jgi:hypothetical protein
VKTIVARTGNRVEKHTSRGSQARIDQSTRRGVQSAARGGPAVLDRKLDDLDREWDVERMIEANASSLALGGTLLGFFLSRWFLLLPAAVTAFLLQHALQGWCPPIPVLRRLGFRTAKEIQEERAALKAMRGDFRKVTRRTNPRKAISAARK